MNRHAFYYFLPVECIEYVTLWLFRVRCSRISAPSYCPSFSYFQSFCCFQVNRLLCDVCLLYAHVNCKLFILMRCVCIYRLIMSIMMHVSNWRFHANHSCAFRFLHLFLCNHWFIWVWQYYA